ncbi:MAG TPA: Rieske 2Fe-2S domain-containing protein [Actinomycetota bacterium]|nr:Rieske 2Fe-2S domain-containing protein [Actinomycetota bacterium]
MRPIFRFLADRIEQAEALDPASEKVAEVAGKAVPAGSVREALAGTWLGHPLHPVLTDVPIGAWVAAGFLDVFGGEESRAAARKLVGIGALAALPTAAAGLADLLDTDEAPVKRVGLVHAAGNVAAIGLYLMSWRSRGKGHHKRGVALAMLGGAGMVGTAYLGGHMSFAQGVGVDETTFEEGPKTWKAVDVAPDRLTDGKKMRATVGQVRLLLYRSGDRVYALSDHCSHRGCALAGGQIEGKGDDAVVVCPCHGSTFRLADGEIVRGPATAPQPAYEARVNGDKLEVRLQQ